MSVHVVLKMGLGLMALVGVLFVALLVYVLHEQRAYSATPDTHDLRKRIGTLGAQYIATRPNGALVIGLWQHDRGFIQGFGHCSSTNRSAPDGETLFEIGSVTKVFTAVTLAKMAEDGVVELDEPISHFLPEGVVSPRKEGREITLRQLATHSSGLPRLPVNFDAVSKDRQDPYANYQAADLYQSLAEVKLAARPGKRSTYSNYGFGLLGHLLALKAGTPYETLVKQTVCVPLGLTNTTISLSAEQKGRLAPGHDPEGKPVSNWNLNVLSGAGALRSNADDLLRFVAANLKPGSLPLSSALLEAQSTHFKGFGNAVGLAWQIEESVAGQDILWHNGGTGGYVSFIGLDKNAHVGVVVLSNYGDVWRGDNTVDEMGMQILRWGSKISPE
jgi:serine-type D-Ala-D-Ala carboxypeptidase/endopeptidase